MAWAWFKPAAPWHPKMVAVGPLGRELFWRLVCETVEHETDGYVPLALLEGLPAYEGVYVDGGALPGMHEVASWQSVVESLVAAGLLHRENGGYRIHDWTDYQLSRDERRARRQRDKERKQRERWGGTFEEVSTDISAVSPRGVFKEKLDARARVRCDRCAGLSFSSESRLAEHLENVHAEVATAPPPEWKPRELSE